METTQVTLRALNLTIAVLVSVLCAVGAWQRTEKRLWAVPPATVALHAIVFYVAVLVDVGFSPVAVNLWSNALRLHEGLLVLVGVWLFLWPARKWR